MASGISALARQARQLVNVLRTSTSSVRVPIDNKTSRVVKFVSVEVFNKIADQDFRRFLEQDFKHKSFKKQ